MNITVKSRYELIERFSFQIITFVLVLLRFEIGRVVYFVINWFGYLIENRSKTHALYLNM